MRRICTTGAALMMVAALTSCDESVQAVLQTDRPFTMYGYLNPIADTQAVRLYTIDGVLEHTSPGSVDAELVVTNVATAERHVLRDSSVQFASGMYGNVFWSQFVPEHEETYRVEARRSDGATSSAQATVPPLAEGEVGLTDTNDFLLPIPVLFRNAPNLIDINAVYLTDAGRKFVSYGVSHEKVPGGSLVTLQFRQDTRSILLDALAAGNREVHFSAIRLRVVVTNAEWAPPGGAFDPNVLVEPATFSNVENGFGFIAAGYPLTIEFRPSDAILVAAGFTIE